MNWGHNDLQKSGRVQWSAPSNIAIVKYWGKKGIQQPLNPSVSFSLNNARTITSVDFEYKGMSNHPSLEVFLDGVPMPSFKPKIETFLLHLSSFLPWVNHFYFRIDTHNTFPHSSGIASSASGMACLAFCLAEIGTLVEPSAPPLSTLLVSGMARLGSGSACRSVYGGWNLWGVTESMSASSDGYAVPITNVSAGFQNIQDTILILGSGQKRMSSSAGHSLMNTHPYRENRLSQARRHTSLLLEALAQNNWALFGEIAEMEALSLHALMVNSHEGYTLLSDASWEALYRVREYRKQSGIPLYFTFDAGPNMHLLFPKESQPEVSSFITNRLASLCENNLFLEDGIGTGPKKLNTKSGF